tara:strand:- start:338 stop:673 length:336 start_codon:yes stop_codon:yes gene_type:complete
MKKELTAQEKVFIAENRLTMSMNDFATHLNTTYNVVRKYMKANNLMITKAQAQAIRIKNTQKNRNALRSSGQITKKPKRVITQKKTPTTKPHWVKDPWNYNLNPVTMSIMA